MKVKVVSRRKTIFISLSRVGNLQQYLPQQVITQVCKARPYWRDLPKRLGMLPLIQKSRFVGSEGSYSARKAVQFAIKHKLTLYYGYFIRANGPQTTIVPHAFCVEDGKVIEPFTGYEWDNSCYYVGFPVPFGDLADCRFETQFDRMDYVVKNIDMMM